MTLCLISSEGLRDVAAVFCRVPGFVMIDYLLAGPHLCARFAPSSEFKSLYLALVCGVNLDGGGVKQLFVDAGLIHILVVSGAHLGTIERLSARGPRVLTSVALAAYAWLTGFGAPIVRAGVARVVRQPARGRGLSRLQTEFLTSLATLFIVPRWLGSRSFLMSWLCALALTRCGPRGRAADLGDACGCYLLLYLFCLSSPVTIGWNLCLAPLIGGLLFPAAALTFVIPGASRAVDQVWRVLIWTLGAGPRGGAEGMMIATAWLWWVPWIAHVSLMWAEVRWRRARAFVCFSP